jgi:iron complex outermembrane receptor protein
MKKFLLIVSALTATFSMSAQDATSVADSLFENNVLNEMEVVASRYNRKTPFTATTLDKKVITEQLGSRDIPNLLNLSPSVYSTNQGGGAGDSRLNVRGFNQNNTAILLNGVPVNDMENGWVYWSNWDGLGDASSNIQVQRGMSAVNLAVPSIGGTVNIITDPAAAKAGGFVKQELGSWNFLKTTVSANTGKMDNGLALSTTISRKTGDGFYDGTWTDAYSYYLGASYEVTKKDKLEFYVVGAPQRHGQNLYRQNMGRYLDLDQIRDLGIGEDQYSEEAWNDYSRDGNLNSRRYNQNISPVDPAYAGEQYFQMYRTFNKSRFLDEALMERENYFHKPQVNLNYYKTINEDLRWSTIAYWSGGKGGGTGTFGDVESSFDNGFARDWNRTIEENITYNDSSVEARKDYQGILRNSINQQWTVGAVSKLFYKVNEKLNIQFGIDARTAQIGHWREVRDLLGANTFYYDGNDFDAPGDYEKGLGDKIAFNFTNTVNWAGSYLQADYSTEKFSANVVAGVTANQYGYTNHFRMDANGNETVTQSSFIAGGQAKGGLKYFFNENVSAYGNAGYVSKNPIFDGVIDDYDGTLFEGRPNEIFQSAEFGAEYASSNFALKAGYYHTLWLNRSRTSTIIDQATGDDILVYITGLNARHSGLELEASYKFSKQLRLDLGASFADWVYTDNVIGTSRDANGEPRSTEDTYYVKGLYVGDAPQNQVMSTVTYSPLKDVNFKASYRWYGKHYAAFNPFDVQDESDEGVQVWRAPSYGVVDLHVNAKVAEFGGNSLVVFGHVFNATNAIFIQDALNNSPYNAVDKESKAQDAEIFLGLPRNFNVGVRYNF